MRKRKAGQRHKGWKAAAKKYKSPVMQAAENAAKVIEGWSASKKAYADRVVSPATRATAAGDAT